MRRLRAERGNVSIIVAFMATVLLGMAALAIDVGAMLVRQSELQAGADAAAMAIARECAGFVGGVAPAGCTTSQALATATDYFGENLPGIAADVAQPVLTTFHEGLAGRVTVTANTQEPTMFGWVFGDENLEVAADATARWGPLVSVGSAYPLAVCKGALPEEGEWVELWSSISAGEMLGDCDGAPDASPMAWLTPDDTVACTKETTLVPPTYVQVTSSDTPPAGMGCANAIAELFDDIRRPRWECGGHECRRRVIAVYDAATPQPHRIHSLVAIEFRGLRVGDDEAHRPWWRDWTGVCNDDGIEDLLCIRGYVRRHIPPDDGPIIALDDLDIAGVDETTVLDVNLVD